MGLDLMDICMTLSRKDHKTREQQINGDLDLMGPSMIWLGNRSKAAIQNNNFEGFQTDVMSNTNILRLL